MKHPDPATRLLLFARPFWGWMVLAGLLGFLTVGSSIGLMAAGAWLISAAALHPSIAGLQVAIVGVRFFGIARGVFRYAERLAAHSVTFRLLRRLRVWFYERIEPLAPARLIDHHSGDLLSRVVADVETQENLYMRVVGPALVALFTAALMVGFLGQYQAGLAPLFLGFFLLGGVGVPLVSGWLSRRAGPEMVTARADLHAALVGSVSGMADLLAFNAAGREAARIDGLSLRLAGRRAVLARTEALSASLMILSAGGAMLAALAASIGRVDGIHLAAIGLGVVASFEALAPLPLAAQQIGAVRAAAGRLYELADARPAVTDPPDGAPAPERFDIEVRGLSFRYAENEPWIFEGLTFNLRQGDHITIAGPSGAGKTTLVNLLLRFWDYETGEVRLGGRDLRQYRQEDVRGWIGVVSQRTHLFNATIRENLLVGRPDADDEQLMEATGQAHIADLIRSLPEGLDTWVGEGGAKLSGGERQRIAIARALLKDAPVLILDEATAHLDTITTRQVMQTIETAMQGRTTLVISHMAAPQVGSNVVWLS